MKNNLFRGGSSEELGPVLVREWNATEKEQGTISQPTNKQMKNQHYIAGYLKGNEIGVIDFDRCFGTSNIFL